MWYRRRMVYINLPEVKWKFEWFKFEYFVSYDYVDYRDFKRRPSLKKKSYLMKDVWELIWAISRYMQAMGVEMPKEMLYEEGRLLNCIPLLVIVYSTVILIVMILTTVSCFWDCLRCKMSSLAPEGQKYIERFHNKM